MSLPRLVVAVGAFVFVSAGFAQSTGLGAAKVTPNLAENIERPLRYRPDGGDFVIENGGEFFNRPLYGGNTAFRVDGGDKPEFVLYLPGRGGNLRLGIRTANGAKWLHDAAHIETRYRPGELLYEVRDPLLGHDGAVSVAALSYHAAEGLILRVESRGIAPGTELVWAYGGVNGQRGKRDGDIGTESVPISQWFQLKPEFCAGNDFEVARATFTLRAKAATIQGLAPDTAWLRVARAEDWNDLAALLAAGDGAGGATALARKIIVGGAPLDARAPLFLSLQRVPKSADAPADLETYREVTAARSDVEHPAAPAIVPVYPRGELAERLRETEEHFAILRRRVSIETPDPFLNAAVGALNVAADAVWDEPQRGIMHGAIAWRTRLLGWRGPYSLDALGWHERARQNFGYWLGRQNTAPIVAGVPPADEKANLARNEAGLHTNGDFSNSHYDMNLVFIDALFRHLRWTGDRAYGKEVWPAIERHLAWERRLFRREYGVNRLPLYEAYAAIWASDDLQYSGGGATHATAYNEFHNREAARLARLIGADPTPYDREAQLLARSLRELLWLPETGGFAECKDWLGLQRVHPDAALWTFYHTVDSQVPNRREAWLMAEQVVRDIPAIPVRGPGVPPDLRTLATSDWMPYDWSINNVVMAEAIHGALGFWQAGRSEDAFAIAKGSLLAAMFMGISPGNVGSMSYLDVYRRESQRDFADGSGVLSRAIVEGLFGVRADALEGRLRLVPGWPAEWQHAAIAHPDFALQFTRNANVDRYRFEQKHPAWRLHPLAIELEVTARHDQIESVRCDGRDLPWHVVADAIGAPKIELAVPPGTVLAEIEIRWSGAPIRRATTPGPRDGLCRQGQMVWWPAPQLPATADHSHEPETSEISLAGARYEPLELASVFNDSVTEIFRHEYRSPRSPFVSLALPKQGIGGWAGGVDRTVAIDDSGLRAVAGRANGHLVLPNGVPLRTPAAPRVANVAFVSQWDNFPRELTVPLEGRARGVFLLMAGSTNPMQSRFENGQVRVAYTDGSIAELPLVNPTTWWPIEQDYFIDAFQFRFAGQLPVRVDLKTGHIRVLERDAFQGRGGAVDGGAATVLTLPLDPTKELKQLTVHATANDVVIGLMAATLVR